MANEPVASNAPAVSYLGWLIGLSAGFALAERVRPARAEQPAARPELANDLAYLAFNGHLYALLTASVAGALVAFTRGLLFGFGWSPGAGVLAGRGFAVQFAVALVVCDLGQWCVHNLLHRVPWLWQLHKVHHSARNMDWAVNFRFHWAELIVYRSLLFVPVLWLGGDPGPLIAVAVFGTFWGHLNHANLDVDLGRLGYLMNSPRMHLWHHDASDEGGRHGKNFGIVLSVWDWLFRTAYWPRDRVPERLGYPGDDEMPRDLPRQLVFPLTRR
ncbi:MAG: sterol desaturase family protein [Deltaproteobacteria bacterium]|nr:sterol desaturase family protein [Deltaproteobacteria bacterium]